ncbi:MAG: YbaK/EbsC family protein [Thermodesulfobacteriota bacterium]
MGLLSEKAQKVQEILTSLGLSTEVKELPQSTRTAQEAAQAISCSVGQIAKSLVFRRVHSGKGVLVLASGLNRVNEARLAELIGEPITKADASFVRRHTGFAIGGVPPIGHSSPLETYIDQDLFQYKEIWAAAGTPQAVFRLTPEELQRIVPGKIISII